MKNKYKIGFYILLICFIATISFVIANFSYAADGNTSTIYSRDELSELLKNQNEELDITSNLFSANNNMFTIYVDNVKVDNLSSSTKYSLGSYTCKIGDNYYTENDNILIWDIEKQQLIIKNFENSLSCSLNYESVQSFSITLAQKIINNNTIEVGRTNFINSFVDDTNGKIFYTNVNTENVCDSNDTLTYESNGRCRSYYFAGNTRNNFVLFAGSMWHIVRINEDQSVRMIYIGTTENYRNPDNLISGTYFPGYVGAASFQSGTIMDASVGFMYSNTGTNYAEWHSNTRSSGPKTILESWYRDNIYDNYHKYISETAIYCNDRSVYSGTGISNSFSNSTYFGGYNRLINNHVPEYNCPKLESSTGLDSKHNCFSVSSTTGNGDLMFGIGMITADEYVFAGANTDSENTNRNFYLQLHNNNWPYTMTPAKTSGIFSMTYQGNTSIDNTSTARAVRPVLSLKSCVKYLKGNGTEANPYEVIIDSTCEAAIN